MSYLRKLMGRVLPAIVVITIGYSIFWTAPASGTELKLADHLSKPTAVGPFTMIDHTGRQVTQDDYLGKYLLVYFGFTHCPDVCPTGLQILVGAVARLGAAGKNIIPVFITVDPERDSPQKLANFVKYFHPRLVGLTGSSDQLDNITGIFGVRYSKVFLSTAQGATDSNYVFRHSDSVYLVGRDGRLLTTISTSATPRDLAQQVLPYLKK